MAEKDVGDYSRVDPTYIGIISRYIKESFVDEANFEVGSFCDWMITTILIDKRYTTSSKDALFLFFILLSRS